MDANHSLPPDPVELVRQLDASAIRQRLDALDRERAALLVLLRAAQRVRNDTSTPDEGTADA
jgi:hypothetical protein